MAPRRAAEFKVLPRTMCRVRLQTRRRWEMRKCDVRLDRFYVYLQVWYLLFSDSYRSTSMENTTVRGAPSIHGMNPQAIRISVVLSKNLWSLSRGEKTPSDTVSRSPSRSVSRSPVQSRSESPGRMETEPTSWRVGCRKISSIIIWSCSNFFYGLVYHVCTNIPNFRWIEGECRIIVYCRTRVATRFFASRCPPISSLTYLHTPAILMPNKALSEPVKSRNRVGSKTRGSREL